MNVDFHFRGKIPVAILGATGLVGQKFIELLHDHPWFEIEALAASTNSAGKKYGEVVKWEMKTALPEKIAKMTISECKPNLPASIAFSALDAAVAGDVEEAFANNGIVVVSNSKAHRLDANVPLVVPEVNSNHLDLIKAQNFTKKGCIITNPNCVVVGLVIALKPLLDHFGLEAVQVSTMQALSGAGFAKSNLDIEDNVIPFIADEEGKVETEPLKILGKFKEDHIDPLHLSISAHCNRVNVSDGHLENVSVRLKEKPTKEEIIDAWRAFRGEPQSLGLPFAPHHPIHYFSEETLPQPKKQRDLEKGMAVSIGRLRECPNFGWKFSLLSHNTIRGAAGAAILNAELLVKKGLIFW